jgi:hypothetical protein
LSVGDYGLQNGDATTFAVNTDTLVRSFILASTPGCIPPE